MHSLCVHNVLVIIIIQDNKQIMNCDRDKFFSYLTDFRYFSLKTKFWMLQHMIKTVKNGPYMKGGVWCRWFQLFSSENKILKVAEHGQIRSLMDRMKAWDRWFQLFLIDFQLFYFLTSIVPVIRNVIHVYVKIKRHL